MLKKIKSNKGFTIVELIVSIAVLLVVIFAMSPLLINSVKYLADITARVKYQNAASNIMNEIRNFAQNTNKANVFNGDEADVSASMSGYGMFYTRSDFSAFVLKTETAEIPVITSEDLDGNKIKVDFDVDQQTGNTDKRRAMLHVVVSVYDKGQDMTYFSTHENATVYKDTDGNIVDAAAPEPLYQHISGIYLVNIGSNIDVPKSRGDRVKEAIEKHLLPTPVVSADDGTTRDMTTAEMDKLLLSDPNSNLTLEKADVEAVLNNPLYVRDYIGEYFRFAIVE
jgi:prepilin-type N-terminal cleavage/methylation domain-containing protein